MRNIDGFVCSILEGDWFMLDMPPKDWSARGLPPAAQLFVLGALAGLVLLAVLAPSLWAALLAKPEAGAPAAQEAPGTFRPTPEQMSGLKIGEVMAATFRGEAVTEGSIANDDDTTTPVFSPYSGRVSRLFAKLGDQVEKGTPLMAVEATEFVQAQNDLIGAVSGLHTAQAQVKLVRANEKRQHELYQAKGAALKDWQQSEADLAAAESNLRSAETALAAIRNRLRIFGRTEKEIDALQAASTVMKMNPEAVVSAPIRGIVTQRQVGLGQYIQAGASNPLYAIGNLSTVWLIANVRETDVPLVHIGDPVEVHVLAYPGRVFKAKIGWIAPAIDPATHRLPVRAEVENPDGALKPMMFANFSILSGGNGLAPAVPVSAIVHDGPKAKVWRLQEDGTLAAREIRTGRISGGLAEVMNGVSLGDRIVTSGTLFIDRAAEAD